MKYLALLVASLAALVAVPMFGSDYTLTFTIQLLMFLGLAYSWNLIGGYAGYSHFGQMSFFGLGAYASALLQTRYGWHWGAAAAFAGLVGPLIALPLGGVMLRLKGPYFAIGMFAMTRVWESLALGLDGITQGGTGIYLAPINDQRPLYAALVVLVVVLAFVTWWIDNSRLGLKLLAIREDETAADALGIKTTKLKVLTFAGSAIAPAIIGALSASHFSYIDPPTAFDPAKELTTIAIALLGGLGTVLGPLIGAVALVGIQEILWARFPQIWLGLLGVMIVLVILFLPRGFASVMQRRGLLPAGREFFRTLAGRAGSPQKGATVHG